MVCRQCARGLFSPRHLDTIDARRIAVHPPIRPSDHPFKHPSGDIMSYARGPGHALSAVVLAACSCAGLAQSYPNKSIRVVAAETAGSSDFSARLIAHGLTAALGQHVVVENRGGHGIIPGEIVSKAAPDGYTLLVYTGNLWISPMLSGKKSYDPVRDFAPITLASQAPNVLVVNPSAPVSSVKDLIDLARAKPGQLNYATGSFGSASHLSGTLFKSMARIDVQHVPYKGSAPALVDLIANRVQYMFPSAASVTPQVKSGKLKALAVTSATPSSLSPGLPTVASSGLPGFEIVAIFGMWAPARTSDAIIRRLHAETVRYLNQPETREKFVNGGVEVIASTPEHLAAAMKSEMTRLGKMIKETGLREP
jgi:tripartite-type tricarboxylate transporter receptor subunit TctC